MKKNGFYIIKDKFFEDIQDPYLKANKTGNRPHYRNVRKANFFKGWMESALKKL